MSHGRLAPFNSITFKTCPILTLSFPQFQTFQFQNQRRLKLKKSEGLKLFFLARTLTNYLSIIGEMRLATRFFCNDSLPQDSDHPLDQHY